MDGLVGRTAGEVVFQRDDYSLCHFNGGWPLTWEPPSQAAVAEWRGIVTLQALRVLTSYGRLTGNR